MLVLWFAQLRLHPRWLQACGSHACAPCDVSLTNASACIDARATCRCIEAAIENPPDKGQRVEIFNQIAETARVRDIASMIQKQTGCEVNYLANPRNEDAENDLDVSNKKFMDFLGNMISLESQEGLFDEVQTITNKYKDRCIQDKILPASFWNKRTATACADNTLEVMATDKAPAEKKLGGVFM